MNRKIFWSFLFIWTAVIKYLNVNNFLSSIVIRAEKMLCWFFLFKSPLSLAIQFNVICTIYIGYISNETFWRWTQHAAFYIFYVSIDKSPLNYCNQTWNLCNTCQKTLKFIKILHISHLILLHLYIPFSS